MKNKETRLLDNSLSPYLDVLSAEYQLTFQQKDSIENRAAIVLGTLAIFSGMQNNFGKGCNCIELFLLLMFGFAIGAAIVVIVPRNINYFDMEAIRQDLGTEKTQGMSNIRQEYQDKIEKNRKINREKQIWFTISLGFSSVYILIQLLLQFVDQLGDI